MAEYMRTGTLTSPKEIDPVQMARGMGRWFPATPRAEPPRPAAAYPGCVALVAVDARISERTPRDLRGVALLAELLQPALGPPRRVAGRREPFGETPWED